MTCFLKTRCTFCSSRSFVASNLVTISLLKIRSKIREDYDRYALNNLYQWIKQDFRQDAGARRIPVFVFNFKSK